MSRRPLLTSPLSLGSRAATIEDVAAAAKVSVATVSRALRGLPNVAAATRARVEKVATELQYRPDPNASRLAAGRTFTVGMAVPILGAWYFSQVIAGAQHELAAAGYDLLLMGVGSGEARRRFVSEWALIQKRVDGLILVDLRLDRTEVSELQQVGAIVAAVGDRYAPFSSVNVDNEAAAAMATKHLINLGHRRIAVIGAQTQLVALSFSVPAERRAGYRLALAEAGIANDPALEAGADFTIEGGASAMRRLLALQDPPTAVFAMSDEMALGALQVARQAGIAVPEELSVIGFDDHDVSAVVGLSTVRQSVTGAGAMAARFVIDTIAENTGPQHAIEDVELVIRTTTAPPATRTGKDSSKDPSKDSPNGSLHGSLKNPVNGSVARKPR
jgi:LacI family transcriptional regulator, repressor for deo operon, udp, cdd, tsx, nupC, and nupG